MIVVIDLIIGSFTERGGEVTVEIKILHLVAQVPEVKVSLQLLDSNETLRQLRVVIGVPRGTLGCGLLDQTGATVSLSRFVIFIWKPDRNLATASVVSYAIARSFLSEADAWLPIITY